MKKRSTEVVLKTSEMALLNPSSRGASIALFVVLVQLLLPLAPLFANEDVSAPAPDVEVAVQEESPIESNEDSEAETEITSTEDEGIDEGISYSEDIPDALLGETSVQEEPTEPVENIPTESVLPVLDPIDSGEEEVELTDPPLPTADDPLDTIPQVDEVPVEEVIVDGELESEDDLVVDEVPPEPVSTTTEEVVVVEEHHEVTTDENRVTFGVDDCARVADGSFYCKTDDTVPVVTYSDRVFAGPDADGDNEIFIEKNGDLTQITFNEIDDAAPYYDSLSETIVWHRLIGARYQIVSYDLESGEEVVLTNDHYNNMQPSRADGVTVWQGWVGNDWEVLLMEDNEIQMLTDNTTHDVGPRINDGYIIWQSEETDGWKVRVYNRLTKETETISGVEGASIENPRFVLLYDAKQENGDIETRGYDLESQEDVPLSAEAERVPTNIPDPDQTGEDRALIVNTTQLKTKTEEESEPELPPLDTNPGIEPDAESATSTTDVVIPPFDPDPTIEDLVDDESASTTPDLIVEPLPVETVEPIIDDLVVAPYIPLPVDELDSQDTVATSS